MLKIIVIIYIVLEITTDLLVISNKFIRFKVLESLEDSINKIKTNPKIFYNRIGICSIILLIVILWL